VPGETWSLILDILARAGTLLAQERMYEWRWEMHPMWWWGWGIGMMAMMFLFWTLVIGRTIKSFLDCVARRSGVEWI